MKDFNKYSNFIKLQIREINQIQKAYQNAVAWLAFSAMLNVVLLACWLWEIVQ